MSFPTSSEAPVVVIDGVTVRYRLPTQSGLSLKEYAIQRLRRRVRFRTIDALSDVSVAVHRGDSLGIVGPNGAGKTTLLRLIARVLTPTEGRVRVRGRVAPILDLVGGFHPELTGRENIFLNGTLLGLTRAEIGRRLDGIVAFAELEGFLDAPIRMYSSGMVARLGFAIASDADPDILVIDEALGVGDERFLLKCADRLDRFRRRGTTLILVSHDLPSVRRLCTRALWIDHGRARRLGPTAEVVDAYLAGA